MKSGRFSVLAGSLLIVFILYRGVIGPAVNPGLYMDQHALMLVILGTLAVSLVAFPLNRLKESVDFIIFGVYFPRKKSQNLLTLARDLFESTEKFTESPALFFDESSDPFIKETLFLMNKKELSPDQFLELAHNLKDSIVSRYYEDAKLLTAIAKFPPALGLLGAATGMIEMMQQVGGTSGAQGIGKAMATALVATFWGIAIANFILLPLADLAQGKAEEETKKREFVIDFIYMFKKKYELNLIFDYVKSKLPLDQRLLFKAEFVEDAFRYKQILKVHQKLADGSKLEPAPKKASVG
jgi:chemotaxis protein MotA